jgi:hypothetical protein
MYLVSKNPIDYEQIRKLCDYKSPKHRREVRKVVREMPSDSLVNKIQLFYADSTFSHNKRPHLAEECMRQHRDDVAIIEFEENIFQHSVQIDKTIPEQKQEMTLVGMGYEDVKIHKSRESYDIESIGKMKRRYGTNNIKISKHDYMPGVFRTHFTRKKYKSWFFVNRTPGDRVAAVSGDSGGAVLKVGKLNCVLASSKQDDKNPFVKYYETYCAPLYIQSTKEFLKANGL